ncbi:hypothetical protein K8R30_00350 [archaeon]|nr:hypothetical protein [archaeon]
MERKTLFYVVSFVALILGLVFVSYMIGLSIIYCPGIGCIFDGIFGVFFLPVAFILLLPLVALLFSFFVKNKDESFRNKFYKSYIKINIFWIIMTLFLFWFFYGLMHTI